MSSRVVPFDAANCDHFALEPHLCTEERQAVALERIKELGGLRQGEQVHTDAAVDEHGPAGGDALSDAGLQRAVTSPSPAAVAPPSAVDVKLARGKWRVFASDALAAMASSLEGALHNDAKLRALFESIDLDSGGTIDKEELRSAFKRADISGDDDALDMMFRAADVDDSGEIDYDEFVGVLRGVKKANTAASVIERRYRTHAAVAKGRGGMGASKVAGVKNAPQSGKEAAALSKAEKDRCACLRIVRSCAGAHTRYTDKYTRVQSVPSAHAVLQAIAMRLCVAPRVRPAPRLALGRLLQPLFSRYASTILR